MNIVNAFKTPSFIPDTFTVEAGIGDKLRSAVSKFKKPNVLKNAKNSFHKALYAHHLNKAINAHVAGKGNSYVKNNALAAKHAGKLAENNMSSKSRKRGVDTHSFNEIKKQNALQQHNSNIAGGLHNKYMEAHKAGDKSAKQKVKNLAGIYKASRQSEKHSGQVIGKHGVDLGTNHVIKKTIGNTLVNSRPKPAAQDITKTPAAPKVVKPKAPPPNKEPKLKPMPKAKAQDQKPPRPKKMVAPPKAQPKPKVIKSPAPKLQKPLKSAKPVKPVTIKPPKQKAMG